jgi:hypothetical protein
MSRTRSIVKRNVLLILLAFVRGKNDTTLWQFIVWSDKSYALDISRLNFGARNHDTFYHSLRNQLSQTGLKEATVCLGWIREALQEFSKVPSHD